MSTQNEEITGLEPANWGDPEGKGLLAHMNDIEFTDDFDAPKEAKEAPKEAAPEAKPEATKTEVKAEAKAEAVADEAPLIDEDFFPSDDKKEEEKVEAKVEGFDETAFDAETEVETKGMEKKAGEKFKELRAELKAFKSKPAEVVLPDSTRQELESLRIAAAERDGLKQRLEEVSSISAKVKMEQSDEYQNAVVKPAGNLFKRSDTLAELHNIDPAVMRSIIKEQDPALQDQLITEKLSELSVHNQAKVSLMAEEFRSFLEKRNELLDEAESKLQLSQAKQIEETNRVLAEQKQATQTIQKEMWGKYKDLLQLDDTEFKGLVAKGLSLDFTTARARDLAFASFAGTALPVVVKQLAAARKELADRDRADGKEVKQRPSQSESIKPTAVDSKKPNSFMEAMAMDLR
jgi:hypothetical protein